LSVYKIRDSFNRDDEVDDEQRERNIDIMKHAYVEEQYDDGEMEMIDTISTQLASVSENVTFRPVNSPDFRTPMSIAFGDGDRAYMKCEVNIDSTAEESAAYCFLLNSRKMAKDVDSMTLVRDAKRVNNHSFDLYQQKQFGFGLLPRRFLTRNVWRRVNEEKLIIVNASVDSSEKFPNFADGLGKSNTIDGKIRTLLTFENEKSNSNNIKTSIDVAKLTCIMQVSRGRP